MITKTPGLQGKVRVTFSMPAAIWADTIYLVGDFNGWNSKATPLHLGDECWSVSLELDADRAYQYRYLVNGSEWYNDWQADRYEPNEHGGDNSVVVTMVPQEPVFVLNEGDDSETVTVTMPLVDPLYITDEAIFDESVVVTMPPDDTFYIEVGSLPERRRVSMKP